MNGTGNYTKSDTVVEVVKALVASMPNANASEVLDKIKASDSRTLWYTMRRITNITLTVQLIPVLQSDMQR